MGLITKEAKVGLTSTNLKHFESLGYNIPKHKSWGRMTCDNSKLIVKVEDLLPTSTAEVEVECDGCGKQYSLMYKNYKKYNHDGIIYCKKCASRILCGGENCHLWNPNLTQEEREMGRTYPEYTRFIKRVLARDNYTCQCCGKKTNDILVHHLDGYNWCKERRTDDTNGITLCTPCHKSFHGIYGNGDNTKVQFEEWLGRIVELTKYDGEITSTRKVFCYDENKIYSGAEEYAKSHDTTPENVRSSCATNGLAKGKRVFWYDEYIKLTKEEVEEIILKKEKSFKTPKKVICITTNKEFNTAKQAGDFYGCDSSAIIKVCRGKLKSCGKLEDGTKLQWR